MRKSEPYFAAAHNLDPSADFAAYVRGIAAATATSNEVFGFKLMSWYLDDFLTRLRETRAFGDAEHEMALRVGLGHRFALVEQAVVVHVEEDDGAHQWLGGGGRIRHNVDGSTDLGEPGVAEIQTGENCAGAHCSSVELARRGSLALARFNHFGDAIGSGGEIIQHKIAKLI